MNSEFFSLVSREGEALKRVQQLVSDVKQPIRISGKVIDPQMSVGVSLYPEDGSEVVDLLKNADIAMYETKKSGRNGITILIHRKRAVVAQGVCR